MKTINVLDKLNTESEKSMIATAIGGFLGAVGFFAAKKTAAGVAKLGDKLKAKIQSKKEKEIEVNPAVEITEE